MIRQFWPRRTLAIAALLCVLLAVGMISRSAIAGSTSSTWVVIGLGDSLTHGTMDAVNNQINTANAYLQRAVELLGQRLTLHFSNPFLDENGGRITPFEAPTNVAIDGEDSFSIDGLNYYKRAGTTESLPDESLIADEKLPSQFENKHDAVLYPINLLARQPVTQLESAEWLLTQGLPAASLNRALVVYWLGNNDSSTAALGNGGSNPLFLPLPIEQLQPVLPGISALVNLAISQGVISIEPYAPASIDRNLTLLSDFATQETEVLTRLVNASSQLDRHIFVLTLPYSSVGYLMDSDDLEYYFRKIDPAYTVPPSFKRVAPPGQPITDPLQGDRISLLTFGLMYALLDSGYSPSYINGVLETGGVQRDGMVLSEAEQRQIMARIDGFNATLKSVAASLGPDVHVVDIGQYLNDVLTGKIELVIDGKKISRKWIRGSAFSFDGVHPGYTGQAFVANFLVDHINRVLGIDAPMASLPPILQTDPYVDHDNDGFAPGPTYPASGLTGLLFLFKDPDDTNAAIQADIPPNVWQLIARALLGEILGRVPALEDEAQRLGKF